MPNALRKKEPAMNVGGYSLLELRILHYIKRHRGVLRALGGKSRSVVPKMADDLGATRSGISGCLISLDRKCVVVCTKKPGRTAAITKVELTDRDMELPPLPVIPAVNIVIENRELEERIIARSNGPSADDILDALLSRIEELQGQVDKLQEIIGAQQEEMEKANRRENRPKPSEHLMGRVRDSLSPEQWEDLRRKGT